ncbi:MAG: peptidyl-prolyl cis-trans isomerase [Acidobacteria bacterium]|nr:peptidyl-prolyl cis-trans isomerase [Acidobacteriota bacterium]
MFQLFRRKDTAVRYVLMGLLGLIAVSMVWTLTPSGMGGASGNRSETVIAQVGDEQITIQEASSRIEQQMRNSGIPRTMASMVANNVVDGLVREKAIELQAQKMGFTVTDDEVVSMIKTILPQLFPNGEFLGKDAYSSFLAQRGLTTTAFESNLRRQVLATKVQNMISEAIIVTPAQVEAEFKKSNEKVKVEYVSLSIPELKKQLSVDDAAVKAEYEKLKATLKVPERRAATLVIVDQARTAAGIQVSDADLRRAYEDNKERYRTPERVQVRHILLKTTDKGPAQVAEAQKKIEDLLKQVQKGADFADLAKKNSEDPGSAINGGDLGFVTKGQMVANFEAAAFALKTPKQLSPVVKTEYGFHILQLTAREDARLRPFEEVRNELIGETQKQVVFDRMQRNIDAIRAAAAKSPEKLGEIAGQYNASLAMSGMMQASDSNFPEIGARPDLTSLIFSAKKGEVTSMVEAPGNKLAVAVVTAIEPEHPAQLADVADRLRNELLTRKATTELRDRAAQLLAKAKAGGADFKKLAAEFKGEFKAPAEFARNGAVEGLGSPLVLEEAFGKPAGTVTGPHMLGDSAFVARVVESIPADLSKLAMDRESVAKTIRDRQSREREDLFADGLVQKLTKDGKVKMFPENVKRLLASYGQS